MGRSVLEQRLDGVEASLHAALADLDVDAIPASDAPRLYAQLDRIGRAATAARTLLARRVADSLEWRRLGHKTPEDHLAATAGIALGAAKAELETSGQLRSLPDTRDRMLAGTVSPAQGQVIAGAASLHPAAEGDLLTAAGTENLQELRDRAGRVRAAADPDPDATYRRLHRQRRATRQPDSEGAMHLHVVGPAGPMSEVLLELDRLTDEIFRERRQAGVRESRDAYVFDALVRMSERSRTGAADRQRAPTRYLGLVRVDLEALRRGMVEGEELCEITGVGPVPVRVARDLLEEATLKLVITNGVDVCNVTSLGRGPTAAQRHALAWSQPTCSVEGCSRTILEYDHRFGAEYKDTRHTRLDETDRLCGGHHELRTRHGWALVEGTGARPLVPPEDPRHPAHHATGPPGGGSGTRDEARAGPSARPGTAAPTDEQLAAAVRAAQRARRSQQQGLFHDPDAA